MPGLLFVFIVVMGYGAFTYGDERVQRIMKDALIAGAVSVPLWYVRGAILDFFRVGRQHRCAARPLARRGRVERLQAFAAAIEKGSLDGRGFYSGGTASVAGSFEGRAFELVLQLERRSWVSYELRLKQEATPFDLERPSLLARLAGAAPWEGRPLALAHELRELLLERGITRVSAQGRRLRAFAPLRERDLALERLLLVTRSLSRLARACEAQENVLISHRTPNPAARPEKNAIAARAVESPRVPK